MGLTYTRGADVQRRRGQRVAITLGEHLLVVTSVVVALAIALAYLGRTRADTLVRADRAAPINLNAGPDAAALEAPLAAAFPYPADRRLAARTIAARPAGSLPNVGALLSITVSADAISRDRSVVVFRERLDAARASARESKHEPPRTVPLLTGADLSALKPGVAVRTADEFRTSVIWCALAMLLGFHAVSLLWRVRSVAGDRLLLALAHLLVGLGFVVMLARPDPLRDTFLLARYTQGVAIALAVFGALSLVNLDRPAVRELSYVPLVLALLLSLLLIVFGSGPGTSQAKVNLGPFQPIEAIRLLMALFLAGFFARRWELIRQARSGIVNVPRLAHVLPVIAGVGAALVLFFFQKDLGPALLLSLMFLSLFAVARGGGWIAGAGLATLVAGFAVGYLLNISNTLAARVAMWQSPWDNAVRGGDQIAQALWGLAAGASAGTGAGLGQTRFVPESHTDLVFAALGEELGVIGLVVVAATFFLIVWRGLGIARRASSDYRFFLALALTMSLAVPVLVMAAGTLGLLPLTGVVTPFLSYGGSAMVANFAMLGLLVAIDRDKHPAADLTPFHVPVRWLGRIAAAGAVIAVAMAATVQTLRADDYLVRPQLGLQADGGRRFQYNPRVLEVLRSIPRGTIYDRNGLPVASGDLATLTKAAPEFAKLGHEMANACPVPSDRCYPAGPALFHVLGDANTRANWSAANSSYVERDSEDLLRGFDDHAKTVATTDRDGRPALAVRRDFGAMVPLVRHRYEPGHPDVKAVLTRNRDVRVTIDTRLQLAAADILTRAARASGSGKGAVIVLDADTGEILASVSVGSDRGQTVVRPGSDQGQTRVRPGSDQGQTTDYLLDRARYGLYAPGSTFKMITAAAALNEHAAYQDRTFVCSRLPSGRIGVRIPGFGPPIHDDSHDAAPHGAISLRDATVRSCNAYFAQLAVAVGADALTHTAAKAGISLNTSRAANRVRANLPHAGYGQGEVVTTPLRIARVAAALGSDGTIREAPIVTGVNPTVNTEFLPAADAHTLASYLRDAVVSGTGRQLKDHPARIAGKTGTAEVDEANPHAWFAGFAPYGPATRRIAFAVVLENAGYGGIAAARVAGEVATAAMSLGLIK
ncbi:MAG TPA: FtsW/RodA/SpoVE family cell cycle protein [Vicinamibacterales bacterium]|nr:FtsW/RodA/SpoVE family cell cycle protein [Vicinamibacterales bacterium]